MSLQSDKIREKADQFMDTLKDAGGWALAIAFIAGAGLLLLRALSSAP